MHNLSILNYISKQNFIIGLVIASVVINLLGFGLPLTLYALCEQFLAGQNYSLWILILTLIIILITENILKLAREFICATCSTKLNIDLNLNIFRRLLRLDLKILNSLNPASYFERLNILEPLKQLLNSQTVTGLIDIPFIPIYLLGIYCLQIKLGILISIIYLLFVSYLLITSCFFYKILHKQLAQTETQTTFILEALSQIHIIKALGMEALQARRFTSLKQENTINDHRVFMFDTALINSSHILAWINISTITIYGAYLIINQSFTIPGLICCIFLANRAIQPFNKLVNILKSRLLFKLVKKYYLELSQLPSVKPVAAENLTMAIAGQIICENMSFQEILYNINLSINPGDVIAITAGVGKTTLLSLLSGALQPTNGKIYLTASQQVAIVSANTALFSGSILENLTGFKPNFSMETINQVLKDLAIYPSLAAMPHGLHTPINNTIAENISRGFKQQLLLAKAFITQPKILFLDEATISLDQIALTNLINYLRKLKGQTTIIMVTTCQRLLTLADRNFIIEDGKLRTKLL